MKASVTVINLSVRPARYRLTDMAVPDPTDSVVRSRIYFALRRTGVPLSIPAQKRFLQTRRLTRRSRVHSRLNANQ